MRGAFGAVGAEDFDEPRGQGLVHVGRHRAAAEHLDIEDVVHALAIGADMRRADRELGVRKLARDIVEQARPVAARDFDDGRVGRGRRGRCSTSGEMMKAAWRRLAAGALPGRLTPSPPAAAARRSAISRSSACGWSAPSGCPRESWMSNTSSTRPSPAS